MTERDKRQERLDSELVDGRNPIPVIDAQANERRVRLEALVAQLDKCLNNLEQGQHWIIGILFTIAI